ncbi:DNA polymerase III subunit delta' [Paenibacillus sp. GCM10012307]|uniref:DNA polymerase III subunit delta n=1 Tax=Paenibacillus roseus TaxID=2798579 RepID=A0A934MNR7_9BACL|nr:DNA polymerase III subunit delta' [Paenibacillus roseus]MBJ6361301.1 DNA polymerase III subunit delta' [Paenibacillus roseus]
MSFQTIVGQENAKRILQQALQRNSVSHAYLFSGPLGTGRRAAAMAFAKALFCEEQGSDACGNCLSCRKFEHGNQPNLLHIAPDGATIKIDQIRQLQRELSYRSQGEGRKVYIMEGAEKLTVQAANSMLKFLEEPASPVVALLLTDNGQAVLPTIRSRTQLVPFYPVAPADMREALIGEGHPAMLVHVAVHLASGLDACREIIQQEGFAETRNVVIQLGKESLIKYTAAMVTLSQAIFKSGSTQQPEQLMSMLLLWYKDMIHFQAGREDAIVYVDQLDWIRNHAFTRSVEGWVFCMESTLEASKRIRAHVTPQLAFEQFLVNLQEGKSLV